MEKITDNPKANRKTTKDPVQVEPEKRKRGRPKGSKNTVKTKRPDRSIDRSVQTEPGENSKFILHDMKLSDLPPIDMNDDQSVNDRIKEYFSICAEDDIKPSVASLGLAFGVSRFTLFDYVAGRNKSITNNRSILAIKKAYEKINSYYEHMMNNGKINPVAGIFLMKNNMGYQDTTQHIIQANTEQSLSLPDIAQRAGLLEE